MPAWVILVWFLGAAHGDSTMIFFCPDDAKARACVQGFYNHYAAEPRAVRFMLYKPGTWWGWKFSQPSNALGPSFQEYKT